MKPNNHNNHYTGPDRRLSLQETMNAMARAGQDADDGDDDGARDLLRFENDVPDELRFWMMADPLLSELYKYFLDAKATGLRIDGSHGAATPMSEVARNMIDSARCAVETRLIELRRSKESRAMVQALIRRSMDAKETALTQAARLRADNFWREFAVPRGPVASEEEQQVDDGFLMIMISLLILGRSLRSVLSIGTSFTRAATNDDFMRSRPAVGSL